MHIKALVPAVGTAVFGHRLPCEHSWADRGNVGICDP